MHFGEIIKKAWHITWRYKWLWVLGVFAGVTGGSSGGGGTSSYRQQSVPGERWGRLGTDVPDWNVIAPVVQQWLPFALVAFMLLVVIGIAFAVIGIGARGGLVWAVNELEGGRAPRLGQAWNVGFSRFWSVLGLGLLLQLPIVVAGLVLAALVIVPIASPLMRGIDPTPALVIGPTCGALAIGVPLLIIAAVVLGIMYITGLRFIIIYQMRTVQAAGESWRAFRARIGDHVLMYVITIALTFLAGLALVVPILLIAVPTVVPGVIAAVGRNWGVAGGMFGLFGLAAVVLGLAFSAIWGTFTSAMWTVFFRRLTGLELVVAAPAVVPPATPSSYPPPVAPSSYPPPTAPAPQPQPAAAPAAEYVPAPPPPPAPEAPPMYAPPVAPSTPPPPAPPVAPPAEPAPPAQDAPDA